MSNQRGEGNEVSSMCNINVRRVNCSQPDTNKTILQVQIHHQTREGDLFLPLVLGNGCAVRISISPLLTVLKQVIRGACSWPVYWGSWGLASETRLKDVIEMTRSFSIYCLSLSLSL